MIISLAGHQGAGKTTVGHLLSTHLGYDHYSTGRIMRDLAHSGGISLLEVNHQGEKDGGQLDKIVDSFQENLGKTSDNFVIDGRLGWHFIPQSLKIYLRVDPEIGAHRILGDRENESRKGVDEHTDIMTTIETTRARRESESRRYMQYYGVDIHDPSHYDLVIDTSQITPEEAVERILREVESREKRLKK